MAIVNKRQRNDAGKWLIREEKQGSVQKNEREEKVEVNAIERKIKWLRITGKEKRQKHN